MPTARQIEDGQARLAQEKARFNVLAAVIRAAMCDSLDHCRQRLGRPTGLRLSESENAYETTHKTDSELYCSAAT